MITGDQFNRGAKRSDRGGAYSGAPAYTLMDFRGLCNTVRDVKVISFILQMFFFFSLFGEIYFIYIDVNM